MKTTVTHTLAVLELAPASTPRFQFEAAGATVPLAADPNRRRPAGPARPVRTRSLPAARPSRGP